MAKQVIKRDGSKEPFDAGKIKGAVESAVGRAGLAPERAAEVIKQVLDVVMRFAGETEEVLTFDLRTKILAELDKLEPSAAESWRKYDQEHGRC